MSIDASNKVILKQCSPFEQHFICFTHNFKQFICRCAISTVPLAYILNVCTQTHLNISKSIRFWKHSTATIGMVTNGTQYIYMCRFSFETKTFTIYIEHYRKTVYLPVNTVLLWIKIKWIFGDEFWPFANWNKQFWYSLMSSQHNIYPKFSIASKWSVAMVKLN